MTAAQLTIDLDALAHNFGVLRSVAGAEVAPVVKADGYGLGAGPVAERLWALGARTFFVARLSEGVALRAVLADRDASVLIFDGLLEAPETYIDARLTPVLNTVEQARWWMAETTQPAVLHVDTGMNRLGVSLAEAEVLSREGLRVSLLISHLACASQGEGEVTKRQRLAFLDARALFPDARASLANSAGAFLGPDYAFDLVRPGISLYGSGPFDVSDARLKVVATLTAPILQIRDVPAGETVGYGAAWRAERLSRVAIIAAGYADGILRSTEGKAKAWLDGAALPYLGRVSMDLIALDLSLAPTAKVGDRVELLGPNIPVDDLAAAAGTIAYEILVRLSARAERTWIGGGG